MYKILVINPGSTSTKIGYFHDELLILSSNLSISSNELENFPGILDQCDFRESSVRQFIQQNDLTVENFDAFVGRGGLLHPIAGGTYLVNEKMVADLKASAFGEHASNLGALLAVKLAREAGRPAFIVDPVVVDEMHDVARVSGHPQFVRKSVFHALNQKAVARLAAKKLGKDYKQINLIVAHLGGGVSVASHENGRVVDVNNALDGDGPFSPERSGTLPVGDLVKLCFSGKLCQDDIIKMIKGQGGLVAYLGTNDMREIEPRVKNGEQYAALVVDALVYQIAKEIAAHTAVLNGKVHAVVLTGGLVYNAFLVKKLVRRVEFIAPVLVFPGESELEALAHGALRVLKNQEKAKEYL
ncbi:butyrate kinase [candidate division KSB1 bacterium]|nr:butyrate kinase [candidate division KSB1 bacterium]